MLLRPGLSERAEDPRRADGAAGDERLDNGRDELEAEWGRLQIEQSFWSNPVFVEQVAANRGQMTFAKPDDVRIVRSWPRPLGMMGGLDASFDADGRIAAASLGLDRRFIENRFRTECGGQSQAENEAAMEIGP